MRCTAPVNSCWRCKPIKNGTGVASLELSGPRFMSLGRANRLFIWVKNQGKAFICLVGRYFFSCISSSISLFQISSSSRGRRFSGISPFFISKSWTCFGPKYVMRWVLLNDTIGDKATVRSQPVDIYKVMKKLSTGLWADQAVFMDGGQALSGNWGRLQAPSLMRSVRRGGQVWGHLPRRPLSRLCHQGKTPGHADAVQQGGDHREGEGRFEALGIFGLAPQDRPRRQGEGQ